MKRKIMLSIMAIVIMLCSMCTITYAWLIHILNTQEIDASTTGIKFVYELSPNDVINEVFTAKNVAFFDIDNTTYNEKEYFLSMACLIEISIKNTGTIDMTYTVNQVSVNKTNPYIACVFSTRLLTDLDIDNIQTLTELLNNNSSVTGNILKVDNTTVSEETFYVYIIGVQPNETTSNNFLNNEYTFTINISGTSMVD